MEELEPFSCWFDTWSETLIAISADERNSPAVANYLNARQAGAELTYETSRSG
jgi:hypothetical protein